MDIHLSLLFRIRCERDSIGEGIQLTLEWTTRHLTHGWPLLRSSAFVKRIQTIRKLFDT